MNSFGEKILMVKKNISLVMGLFIITSLTAGCDVGRETINHNTVTQTVPVAESVVNVAPEQTPVTTIAEFTALPESEKIVIVKEIVTVLAEEELALSPAGVQALGLTEGFSIKVKEPVPISARDAEFSVFFKTLRELSPLRGQERKDKITEMKKKWPTYFTPLYTKLCYVMVPKFRYCNEDGS
jgi:hypothetical protein